jgi:MerR family transcriptional regulator, light-induced transcriptional regulator
MTGNQRAGQRELPSYSMRVVTRLTGLHPDTIRAWERRYGAIEPDRSGGGTRKFGDREVQRLGWLAALTKRGHRIGDVARLGDAALRTMAAEPGPAADSLAERGAPDGSTSGSEQLRARYLDAVKRFDVRAASDELNRAAVLLDGRQLVHEIVLPLMRAVGDGWKRGELLPAHEHLVSGQVRGLVDAVIRLSYVPPGALRVVVSTPPGELHEFGAIVGAMLAATNGLGVVYLGANLPIADIARAARESRAHAVLLALAKPLAAREREGLALELAGLGEEVELWLGLAPSHPFASGIRGATILTSFEQLEAVLADVASRARPVR